MIRGDLPPSAPRWRPSRRLRTGSSGSGCGRGRVGPRLPPTHVRAGPSRRPPTSSAARAIPVAPSERATIPRAWSRAASATSGIEPTCVSHAASQAAASAGRPACCAARTPVTTNGARSTRSSTATARARASRQMPSARSGSPACRATSAMPHSGGRMISISSLAIAELEGLRQCGRRIVELAARHGDVAEGPVRGHRAAPAPLVDDRPPRSTLRVRRLRGRPRDHRQRRPHHVGAMRLLDRIRVADAFVDPADRGRVVEAGGGRGRGLPERGHARRLPPFADRRVGDRADPGDPGIERDRRTGPQARASTRRSPAIRDPGARRPVRAAGRAAPGPRRAPGHPCTSGPSTARRARAPRARRGCPGAARPRPAARRSLPGARRRGGPRVARRSGRSRGR